MKQCIKLLKNVINVNGFHTWGTTTETLRRPKERPDNYEQKERLYIHFGYVNFPNIIF